MDQRNFYAETKFCNRCRDYVRYLQSLAGAYCVECGAKVRLFSRQDFNQFLHSLAKNKGKAAGDNKQVS